MWVIAIDYSVHIDTAGIILLANDTLFWFISEADEEARRLYQAYDHETPKPALTKGAHYNFNDKTDTAPTFISWNQTENRVMREDELGPIKYLYTFRHDLAVAKIGCVCCFSQKTTVCRSG